MENLELHTEILHDLLVFISSAVFDGPRSTECEPRAGIGHGKFENWNFTYFRHCPFRLKEWIKSKINIFIPRKREIVSQFFAKNRMTPWRKSRHLRDLFGVEY
jgi:hypothetical protein